jgi:hypothetical protein
MSERIYELEPDDGREEAAKRSQPTVRCRTCGSGLAVAPRDGICPECDCPIAGPEAAGKIIEEETPPGWTTSPHPMGKPLPPKCEGCGYDLRGHGASAKCPECGLPRKGRSKSEATDPLYLMPRDVIITFRNGAIAVMACLIGSAIGTFIMLLLGASGYVMSVGMLTFSIAWVICVWQITPAFEFRQAVRRGFSSTSKLRRAARWMQFAWPAAAICLILLVTFGGGAQFPEGLVQLLMLGFVLLGLTALIVVSLLFEELSDWSCDDLAEKLFRGSQWGMACGALIVVLALLANAVMPGGYLTLFLFILSLPAAFMLVVSIATYIYALLSLSKSVTLSLYHANEHNDRIRRREQRLREQEEREERLRRQATAAQPES